MFDRLVMVRPSRTLKGIVEAQDGARYSVTLKALANKVDSKIHG